jgi:hypothetical protein
MESGSKTLRIQEKGLHTRQKKSASSLITNADVFFLILFINVYRGRSAIERKRERSGLSVATGFILPTDKECSVINTIIILNVENLEC